MRELLLDAVATYRLTRLVVHDTIIERQRGDLLDALEDGTRPFTRKHLKVAELLGCPWCVSIWLGAGVVAARRVAPRLWDPIATMLTASAIAGILSRDDG